MDVFENEDNGQSDKTSKKVRRRFRKKALFITLRQQMEFYFSDANISKDRFMTQLLEKDPYIDISLFFKFNKIKSLTSNEGELRQALQKSETLELSEDGKKVKRTKPFQQKTNEDDCTIYVENIPTTATHDWLQSVFSEYGSVAYISMPKFKESGQVKGFAFIEFNDPAGAKGALEAFGAAGCNLSASLSPENLLSIKTFGTETESKDVDIKEGNKQMETTKTNNKKGGKRKFQSVDEKEHEHQKQDESDSGDSKKPKTDSTEDKVLEVTPLPVVEINNTEKKKKKKRKRTRKGKEGQEVASLGLQVMAKKEWKRLRNQYLNQQRNNLKEIKFLLRKEHYKEQFKQNQLAKEENNKPKEQIKTNGPAYQEGLIVKITFEAPVVDVKQVKTELKSRSSVAYVDIKEGDNIAFVRCEDTEGAQLLSQIEDSSKAELLTGDDEKLYWELIMETRKAKFESDKTKLKDRGRNKVKRKLAKIQHVRFDD